ncbi:MAG: zinc-ribbon domain-containing protein [Micavibrio sp.]|nr:zinc-ribbon domain-containing protein [Micavibrio sp.]
MILTCPTCSTKFAIPSDRLLPAGRNVKCSNCSEVWFALPDPDELIEELEKTTDQIPESVRPLPDGSNVPVVQDEEGADHNVKTVMKSVVLVLAVFALSAIALFVLRNKIVAVWPPSAAIYDLVGLNVLIPGEGVEFDRISASINAAGEIHIEGLMINLKSTPVKVPTVKAIIKNSGGNVIEEWFFAPSKEHLDKEETITFSTIYGNIPLEADSLHLTFALGGESPPDLNDTYEVHHNNKAEEVGGESSHEAYNDEAPSAEKNGDNAHGEEKYGEDVHHAPTDHH